MVDLLSSLANLLDPPREEGDQVWYCGRSDCDGQPHDDVPYKHARAKQCPPDVVAQIQWFIWLILAGRGYGKTRTGGEWLVEQMRHAPGSYWALIAPTFDDGRDTMVEGESGLLFVLDSHKIRHEWNRSMGQMTLENEARLDLFSSKEPERLRGPNLMGAWGDEPATWIRAQETWDNLLLMCRVGNPRIVLTGTPQPSKFVKMLKAEADYVTEGSSYENQDNLSEVWFNRVVKPLEGTRKGLQEIHGKILEDTEGTLWVNDQIDFGRLIKPKRFDRLIVAVDPSVSAKRGDECGITVGGTFRDQGYLLADVSLQANPAQWARVVADAYDDFGADCVVGEVNNGGDLVKTVMQQERPGINFQNTWASRGKTTRAEPVAAAYGDPTNPETWKKATIHHVRDETFQLLEDEMTTWVQGDRDSPNRLDSLVWLFSKLLGLENNNVRGRGGLRFYK